MICGNRYFGDYKYYGAMRLQMLRCYAPTKTCVPFATNITARCAYKCYGATHLQKPVCRLLQISRRDAPTNVTVLRTYKNLCAVCYKYCGAMRCGVTSNPTPTQHTHTHTEFPTFAPPNKKDHARSIYCFRRPHAHR